ncbi:glycoside hydrolase family 3 C-terminal domain-containing protein [Ruminococcaceae bacterium OttesenSCG-928-A16]|nr:glycoside hydrolase family 3 C-terminal domain-containing protein [Ruminococcaceae bacterium OttesenSCG-928-A16]
MDDKQILSLLQSLTLEEKAALCSGADNWTTKPNWDKDIPVLRMADGPHGVRLEDKPNEKITGHHSLPSTCFPPECALACSFSPALAARVGSAIASECRHYDIGMILGPGVNIKRSPLGGRNFEYYSEDPLLAGEMAAGFIKGVQSRGVATSLKHFAVNNQETKRMSIDAVVDDRALFDIYLKPFEIAVKKAQPATVMCSYNRIGGTYASENRRLLTDVLRLRFGFTGAVISDWGAVNHRPSGVNAGLDLEMPSSGGANDYAIVQAVKNGDLSEDALNTACWNLLKLIFTYAETDPISPIPQCDFDAHHALAVEALEKSAVLLKNNGMLPLPKEESIAIIGEMAVHPRYQGGGSSIINPKNLVGFVEAMQNAGMPFTYAPGHTGEHTTPHLLEQAVKTAAAAKNVVLFLGLPDSFECEGFDRDHLAIPAAQIELLNSVAAVNPNVCVVLCCGAPVETPWLDNANALLCLYLGGEGLGEAALNLLFGNANPSGKLPESWPLTLQHTPSYHNFPSGPNEVSYNESIFVGYRYYNTAKVPVRFAFGHGLSYTSYAYSRLTLRNNSLASEEPLTLTFTLTNTGTLAGDEIAQVYLRRKNSARFQPLHELKAFTRQTLAPGQSQNITLQIPYQSLGYFNPATKTHVVEQGEYEIQVGPSSHNLPLTMAFTAAGTTLAPGTSFAAGGFYSKLKDNSFPADEFDKLYSGPRTSNSKLPQKGEYTLTTTADQLTGSFWGRRMLYLIRRVSCAYIRFSTNPKANHRAGIAMANDLPFKNIMQQTNGIVNPKALQHLLAMCNGKPGFWRLVAAMLKRPPYARKRYLPQTKKENPYANQSRRKKNS